LRLVLAVAVHVVVGGEVLGLRLAQLDLIDLDAGQRGGEGGVVREAVGRRVDVAALRGLA
jgi:hypothetical protein